ncbi:MAG: glycerophosphodiester phosphodiesterase family protein [Clostridia bacterium]|nr:glycerophosphodiester phosphodiesterase family protein [Clostridia bacterium]MDD4387364.1 glycerophosphodiester phosphodiesterase family protein [Clostridia bacterium]
MTHLKNEVYSKVFAHRGFHLNYPENTLESFICAVEQNFAIEVDIRFLKCGTIVCFHDMYMKRLLSVPGLISNRNFNEIKNYKILGTKCKVPKLKDVLSMVNGRVTVLIEIKGIMNKAYQSELESIISNYQCKVFFHTTNIITYFKAKKVWGENVFFVLNPFRKRFEFVKGKHYQNIISVPTIDDVIVEAEDSTKTVIRKIWITFNKLNTRVKSDHWLLNYKGKKNQIQHRGIVDKNLKEHSREAFEKCIKLDKVIEFDVTKYGGNIVCYHSDTVATRMGQKKSISDKLDLKNSLLFEDVLSIIDGRVPIIIDIKDFNIFDRSLQDNIMNRLKNYKGEFVIQSFNPLVNMYFLKKYEHVVRGQVGHSLNGVKKMHKVILTIVNFCLFYRGRPDYIVYDLDPNVYLLSKFNNILGLPVIGYTAVNENDIIAYSSFFDNFIVEGEFELQEK